jgi:hypothetical protein
MRKSFGDKRFAWLLARFLDSFVVPTGEFFLLRLHLEN